MSRNFFIEDKEAAHIEHMEAKLSANWVVSFIDLMSLLMAFFVLLFSMSTVDEARWNAMTDTLSRSLRPEASGHKKPEQQIVGKELKVATDLGYLSALLEAQAAASATLAGLSVHALESRTVISLPSDVLFAPGGASLSDKGRAAMNELGTLLRNVKNTVQVTGHSDPTPVSGGGYSSNWELSLARALSVANELRRAGFSREIAAYGAADSQAAAIASGFPADRRSALARRVDIVVESTE